MRLPDGFEQLGAKLGDELRTPALVIDLDAVEHNIRATIKRCGGPDRWRPHVKTHKQSKITDLAIAGGLRNFKCATFAELVQLVDRIDASSLDDEFEILLAYPVDADQAARMARLAADRPRVQFACLADDPAHFEELALVLDPHAPDNCGIFPDLDVGMQRTGSPASRWIEWLASGLSRTCARRLHGVHAYEGHLRWEQSDLAQTAYREVRDVADAVRECSSWNSLDHAREPLTIVTSGSHAYHHALASPHLRATGLQAQVSPGTIVLSDLRSHHAVRDIGLTQAAFVLSRVIHVGEGRFTLDAGSKALSPDVPAPNCEIVGWPRLEPRSPSEEHLPIHVPEGLHAPARGDRLWLVPAHVCTTVNMHRSAIYVRSATVVDNGLVNSGHVGGLLRSRES